VSALAKEVRSAYFKPLLGKGRAGWGVCLQFMAIILTVNQLREVQHLAPLLGRCLLWVAGRGYVPQIYGELLR
jgi:hypothetical protein